MSDPFYEMVKGASEGASQPLCKLIDAVRAGAGLMYEPMHVKRIAKAEAEALIIKEKAEVEVSDIRQRAAARLTNVETRRQQNIESIVEKAAESLPEECSEAPVDQDWMANFIECCKDVGRDEVQALWGKLLAGEVTEPGAFSRRALNALKLLSGSDAALFTIIGFRVWRLNDWPVLFIPGNPHNKWPSECPFRWSDVKTLEDIGFVEAEIIDEHHFMRNPRRFSFDYYGKKYDGFSNPMGGGRTPYWVNFTPIGAELFPLVEQEAGINDEYLEACNRCFELPSWTLDEGSDFRELMVPDDLRDLLNINESKEEPANASGD